MRYLLDTHTFLWWIVADRRLSQRVTDLVSDPASEVLVSAASFWEIAIKAQLGHLAFPADPVDFVPQQVLVNGFAELPIASKHALQVYRLPLLHRDPFDRLLVAQAQVEGVPLLSADESVAQYAVEVIW